MPSHSLSLHLHHTHHREAIILVPGIISYITSMKKEDKSTIFQTGKRRTRLTWGCCSSTACGADTNTSHTAEGLVPSLFAILHPNPNTWLVCRVLGGFLDSNMCFSEAIRITGLDTDTCKQLVDEVYPIQMVTPEVCDREDAKLHGHFHLKSDGGGDKSSAYPEVFVGSIYDPPIPVTSLSLHLMSIDPGVDGEISRILSTDRLRPLLLACLKRQLAACPLLWSNQTSKVGTEYTIENVLDQNWSFSVQSVVVLSSDRSTPQGAPLFGIVLPSTRITLYLDPTDDPESEHTKETQLLVSEEDTVSVSPTAQVLVDTIRFSLTNNSPANIARTFLLSGPPGVGKTHAVRQAIRKANHSALYHNASRTEQVASCQLVSIKGSELLVEGSQPAEAAIALRRQFYRAKELSQSSTCTTCLIFLDECDALLSAEPVASMLSYLLDVVNEQKDWRGVILVAATNRVDCIPAYLRRPGRFDREIPLVPPTSQERVSILQTLLKESDVLQAVSVDELKELADLCIGYVAADLAALVRRASLLSTKERALVLSSGNGGGKLSTFSEFLQCAMEDVGASALRDAALSAPPSTTWDDIAGDAGGAKTALRQAVEWPRTKRSAYKALGLSTPRGILLHGPPGCAKTTLARAAAGSSGVAFLSLSPADVYASSYVGEAEAIVRRAFDLARSAAPCVLFFDEIDAIIGTDEHNDGSHGMSRGSSTEARVLSTFLNEMDGVDGSLNDNVLVLGATNRPWTLDAALLRPGRFDKIIYVPPPDYEARRSILSMQCKKWPVSAEDPINVAEMADEAVSGGMTGAEIKGACNEAAIRAMREMLETNSNEVSVPKMRQLHLKSALEAVRPLLSNPNVVEEFLSFEAKASSSGS